MDTLQSSAPSNIADLVALHDPPAEALETMKEAFCFRIIEEVNERVAEPSPGLKVDWQIHKIVAVFQSLIIQELNQLIACQIVWDVPHHHSCAQVRRC